MRSFMLFTFLSLGLSALAQEKFALPKKLDVLPATYLEELRVENPSRQLSKDQRRQLCKLFADSYLLSKRKYKQDYLINAQAPVYKLFKANFPGIAAKEGEGGHVFMGDIFELAKKQPECSTVGRVSSAKSEHIGIGTGSYFLVSGFVTKQSLIPKVSTACVRNYDT